MTQNLSKPLQQYVVKVFAFYDLFISTLFTHPLLFNTNNHRGIDVIVQEG
jgi:hypothetical protein